MQARNVRSPDGSATVQDLRTCLINSEIFRLQNEPLLMASRKKQVISLLAQNSHRAQKLYHDEGSTPAYHYVSFVVSAAQRQSAQAQAQVRAKAKGVER